MTVATRRSLSGQSCSEHPQGNLLVAATRLSVEDQLIEHGRNVDPLVLSTEGQSTCLKPH